MGVAEDRIERARDVIAGKSSIEEQGLWPAHLPALQALGVAGTQWRTRSGGLGPGIYVGLDYASAEVAFRYSGITLTKDQWQDFRTLEGAAVDILNGAKIGSDGELLS